MAVNESRMTVLTRLLDQFRNDIEPDVQVLSNVKDVTDPSAPDRRGAFGKIIDLDWEGKRCVGKELHEIMFQIGADVDMRASLQKFCKEIKMMSKLKHDNIVTFYGVYYKQSQGAGSVAFPVLVMERMECSLRNYIETNTKGAISDVKITKILCDVARGLVYLHEGCSEPLAHRDLSSNNILLTLRLQAKVADFGESRALDRPGGWNSSAKLTKVPGIAVFMPPETWEDPPYYTTAVDIFSFGCVIIHLVTWQWPQPDAQIRRVTTTFGYQVRQIISELERRQKWISMFGEHHTLLPIVKQCLQDKINNRPKCKELLSMCEKAFEKYGMRNIFLIGLSGSGKTTLIHSITEMKCYDFMFGRPIQMTTELSINGNNYRCTFLKPASPFVCDYNLSNVKQKIVEQITNSNHAECLKSLNLIIYVAKYSYRIEEWMCTFQIYKKLLPESISVLVITGCDFITDAERTRIVEKLKSHEQTKDIAASMGKGIYTVGFPNLHHYESEYKELMKVRMQKDITKLHRLIEESSDSVDVLKESSPGCDDILKEGSTRCSFL